MKTRVITLDVYAGIESWEEDGFGFSLKRLYNRDEADAAPAETFGSSFFVKRVSFEVPVPTKEEGIAGALRGIAAAKEEALRQYTEKVAQLNEQASKYMALTNEAEADDDIPF